MTTVLNGAVGGLVVGAVAGLAVQLQADDASATTALLDRAVGSARASSRRVTFAVQLLYGCLAGGLLLVLELNAVNALGVPPALTEALGLTVAWSALLFGLVVSLWRTGLSGPFDRAQFLELLTYHLVYGLGLGLWIRLTWLT